MSEITVSIRNLVKNFGDRTAVQIDALDLRRDCFTGIIGPNGAGKTTLVKIIAGLLKPTSIGRLRVLDEESPLRDRRRDIGLVTDASQLYGTLTVAENLNYMARLYHVPKRERAHVIEEALEACALVDRRNDRVATLSTGLKQRVNIARAIAGKPQLLLLDEPTSGLDPSASQRVYDALLKLQATGITMILCSHLMSEVEDLCDRVLFMNSSKIVSDATPERMKEIAGERVYTISVETEREAVELRRKLEALELRRTALRRSNGQFLVSVYGFVDPSVIDRLGVDYQRTGASLSDAFVLLAEGQ
ncbi:ABC transporter ATP-binding protein [Cutibacterium sp.]|uniref:ABC transporter ATP-binding protein n=1 Tax=Cutibacterium sp. TaxID=1912221 RepID=UPI0026DBB298|nr:ABC transporter ATP-binding protein [Cutibacterium sp.]MDO4411883.1 ABC transporter ATP-binding protein [Cutibacterium sp.]